MTGHRRLPHRDDSLGPRRVMALAGSALVMVLSIGGSLGFVPGAAAGPPVTRYPAPDSSSGGSPTGESGRSDEPASPVSTVLPPVEDTSLLAKSGRGRRIVYDVSDQRVWLVGPGGHALRTYLVSGGKHHNLKPATYHVTSMSRQAVSFDHKETMNYMVRFTTGVHAPIGFHDIPAFPDGTLAQSRDQLGTALSSGCIRQWITDARALWDFSEVGTTVVVVR